MSLIDIRSKLSLFLALPVMTIIGCDAQHKLSAEISIPYMHECRGTVQRAQNYYDKIFNSNLGYVVITVNEFDRTGLGDFGVDGLLNISAYGDLELLNNTTAERFIRGAAGSIGIDCLPDTYISFNALAVSSVYEDIKKRHGDPLIPVIRNGEVFIYLDKKNDKVEHWR